MNTLSSTSGTGEVQRNQLDTTRLTTYIVILVLFAVLFLVVSRVTDINMISLAPVYMFTPLIAGLIVCLTQNIPLSNAGLRIGRPRWLAISTFAALPLVGFTLLFSVAVPNIGFDPTANPAPGISFPSGILGVIAAFALILGVGTTANAVLAFGEEFGWRGYLLWELAPLGFWKASILIGFIWGVWHTPVIIEGYNYPSFPFLGVGMMTIACIAFSPVYTYFVVRAESVFATAFLHGVFNGSAGLILVYTVTDSTFLDELVANPVGISGVVIFSLIAIGIAIRGPPSLNRSFAGQDSITPSE